MDKILHITSGDCAGEKLVKSGLPGEVHVWRDILYDGPRKPGWPDEKTLSGRASFLEQAVDGGLSHDQILRTLTSQYDRLASAHRYSEIVLWFDACLFDQSMLVHILSCLHSKKVKNIKLICIAAFPGIIPFHGLGQLNPGQLASLYTDRKIVTDEQLDFSVLVDKAFAEKDIAIFKEFSRSKDAPLPWIPAIAARWLQEQPDPGSGLGRLETLALEAVRAGCETPDRIYSFVAASEVPPMFWGDTTLWEKINNLAHRSPPLIKIEGPSEKLPQWISNIPLDYFRIYPIPKP